MFNILRKTVKETAIYSIGNIASKLVGIVLLPLYSSSLDIALFGLLTLFEICFEIITPISNLGIDNALMRWYYDDEAKDKEKSLYFTVFTFSVICSFVILLLAYFIMLRFKAEIFSEGISPSLILIFLSSVFARLVVASPLTILRVQQKASRQTAAVVLGLLLNVGFAYLFLKYYGMGLYGIFLAQVIANGLLFVLLFPTILDNIKLHIEKALIVKMLKYSYPLVFSGLLTTILVLSDRYILKYYYTLGDVGVYSLAYKISNIIKICITTSFLQSYVISYFREMTDVKSSDRFLVKSLTYFLYISVYLSLFMVYFGKEILVVLTSGNEDYWQAYVLLPFLLIAVVLGGLSQISSMPMRREKHTKLLSICGVSAAVLNIILNFVFIPHWGAYGAVVSTIFSQLLVVLVYFYFLKNSYSIVVEYRRLLSIFLLAALIFIPSLFLGDISLILRLPMKLIILFSFPFILYILGFYNKDELHRIKGAWKKWSKLSNIKKNISNIRA